MITEVLQFLGEHAARLLPWTVVDVYDHAVLLRVGKFRRELAPGLRWRIPLIDRVLTYSRVWTTERTPPQSVTTEAGKCLVVSLAVTWRVTNGRKFLLEVYDGKGAVLDCLAGVVGEVLQQYDGVAPYSDLLSKIRRAANRQGRQWGISFRRVQFVDLCESRTLRILTDHAASHGIVPIE